MNRLHGLLPCHVTLMRSIGIKIDELKERNTNLRMKLQSEELLLQSVSKSYQDKLREKEVDGRVTCCVS